MVVTNFGMMGVTSNAVNIGAFLLPPTKIKGNTRKSVNYKSPFYVGKNNIKPPPPPPRR